MTPDQLIVAYNRATAKYQRPGVPGRRPTKATRQEATGYLAWCAEQQVDPERFLSARIEAAKARVRLRDLHRVKPEFLSAFREWGSRRQAEHLSQQRIADAVVPIPSDPGNTLTPLTEALKAAMSATPGQCMVSPEALGWHPDSSWCQSCPVAVECRSMLLPSIVARRQGRLGDRR